MINIALSNEALNYSKKNITNVKKTDNIKDLMSDYGYSKEKVNLLVKFALMKDYTINDIVASLLVIFNEDVNLKSVDILNLLYLMHSCLVVFSDEPEAKKVKQTIIDEKDGVKLLDFKNANRTERFILHTPPSGITEFTQPQLYNSYLEANGLRKAILKDIEISGIDSVLLDLIDLIKRFKDKEDAINKLYEKSKAAIEITSDMVKYITPSSLILGVFTSGDITPPTSISQILFDILEPAFEISSKKYIEYLYKEYKEYIYNVLPKEIISLYIKPAISNCDVNSAWHYYRYAKSFLMLSEDSEIRDIVSVSDNTVLSKINTKFSTIISTEANILKYFTFENDAKSFEIISTKLFDLSILFIYYSCIIRLGLFLSDNRNNQQKKVNLYSDVDIYLYNQDYEFVNTEDTKKLTKLLSTDKVFSDVASIVKDKTIDTELNSFISSVVLNPFLSLFSSNSNSTLGNDKPKKDNSAIRIAKIKARTEKQKAEIKANTDIKIQELKNKNAGTMKSFVGKHWKALAIVSFLVGAGVAIYAYRKYNMLSTADEGLENYREMISNLQSLTTNLKDISGHGNLINIDLKSLILNVNDIVINGKIFESDLTNLSQDLIDSNDKVDQASSIYSKDENLYKNFAMKTLSFKDANTNYTESESNIKESFRDITDSNFLTEYLTPKYCSEYLYGCDVVRYGELTPYTIPISKNTIDSSEIDKRLYLKWLTVSTNNQKSKYFRHTFKQNILTGESWLDFGEMISSNYDIHLLGEIEKYLYNINTGNIKLTIDKILNTIKSMNLTNLNIDDVRPNSFNKNVIVNNSFDLLINLIINTLSRFQVGINNAQGNVFLYPTEFKTISKVFFSKKLDSMPICIDPNSKIQINYFNDLTKYVLSSKILMNNNFKLEIANGDGIVIVNNDKEKKLIIGDRYIYKAFLSVFKNELINDIDKFLSDFWKYFTMYFKYFYFFLFREIRVNTMGLEINIRDLEGYSTTVIEPTEADLFFYHYNNKNEGKYIIIKEDNWIDIIQKTIDVKINSSNGVLNANFNK